MRPKSTFRKIIFASVVLLVSSVTLAQGDGSRNLLWGPTGVTALIPKWMHMNQNITPGNILVKDADISIDAFPITLVHNFGLGGRFAQLMFSAVPGSVSGRVVADQPGLPAPHYSASGFADGFVGFKFGLINQPALNVMEYAKFKKGFSMMFYGRVWYSGTYDRKNPLSLGTNRNTFELGLPMNVQLSSNPKRPTWLEMYPAVHLFTPNNSPVISTQASKTQQLALFTLENHLTHNFTDNFWVGVDLRYQLGGALKLDEVKQNNSKINILGSGLVAGYQVLSMLGISAGYDWIIAGDNGAKSTMFRLTGVISYANIKKLKAQAAPVAVTPVIPVVVDTDGDGIPDVNDKCPTVPGLAKYGGCPIPDTDGDGVNDEQDKCPTVPGLAKYGGCPIPDTDGDGINDEQDKCPTVPGLSRYGGCPIPDSDGDGINDEEDKCPNTPGIAANLGCPEMILYYKRKDDKLDVNDKAQLDKVANFLINNPSINIIVEGHTSTSGTVTYNQKLSEKRASNSAKYLISKGVSSSRIKSVGYGEQYPIGDNSTEKGRADSRRTVIKVAQ